VTAYRHTQPGNVTRVVALASGVAVAAAFVAVGSRPGLWLALAVTLVAGIGFGSLTTEVTEDRFTFWFGPGVLRRSFPLADVQSCTPVTNPWWYGWGIHLTPYGWLYNVGGREAVQLTLRTGRALRVGTDEPQRLCETIDAMKRRWTTT
jgi:hypothetical protein